MSSSDGLSALRFKLARKLEIRASMGLCAFAALLAVLALTSAACFYLGIRLLADGNWPLSVLWLLVAGLWARVVLAVAECLFDANDRPEGVKLSRSTAPSLYGLIDDLAARCGGAPIDALWITGDMNAAVLQRPRWGLVGRMETHLLIGLPLAHSVSDRQLGAILAHEYGHLVCQRRGLAAWGCHARAWWFRVVDRCIETIPVLGRCVDHLTLPDLIEAQRLSRVEEFEADREAARAVGARLVAETLVEVAVKEHFLVQDYWAKVMAQCKSRPRPTIRPYREMGSGMVAGFIEQSDRAGVLLSMFENEQDGCDLHPSLPERLQALGEIPDLSTAVEDSAAERHLTPLLSRLAWELDRDWWNATRDTWRRSYRRARRNRLRLARSQNASLSASR